MSVVDVLIIGSEGAGSRAAIAAAQAGATVMIVTKGRLGKSGATVTATADISVDSKSIVTELGLPGDPKDSPEAFREDILACGKYINYRPLVDKHVELAPQRVKEMLDWGMKVRGVIHCPGHRYPRGVFTTGREITRVLKRQLLSFPTAVREDMMALELLVGEGRIAGVLALDLRSGELNTIRARSVILATGGGMMLYPYQTAPEELTGDGYAMAFRAGALLTDMEMVQFMPYSLLAPPALKGNHFPFNITAESSNSLEGWLLNRQGQRFMAKWDQERMEKSTRDLIAVGITAEIKAGRGTPDGGVYLSFAHLPRNLLREFPRWALKPQLKENWRYEGLDFSSLGERLARGEAIEVGIASHFFVGGVAIDDRCQTSLPGLFAAGEVTGGFHGANRLSGNACLEILVEGELAGRNAARYARDVTPAPVEQEQINEGIAVALRPLAGAKGISPFQVQKKLQRFTWDKLGAIRNRSELAGALAELAILKQEQAESTCGSKDRVYNREWVEALQNRNRLTLLHVMTQSALAREESRGVHYREDYPEERAEWCCNLLAQKSSDGVKITRSDIHRERGEGYNGY